MLPEKFLKRMKDILKDDLPLFLDAMENEPVRALRFNRNKKPEGRAVDTVLLSPLSFHEGAYTFSCDKIGTHPYHHAGAFYVQEPSAMMPVCSLDIDGSWKILDMCASPGGKSTQAAERLTSGILISNEIVPSRCRTLSGNIERLGFKNVTVTNTDTTTLALLFPHYFDLVIADVPCSGEGMFRKDEGAVKEWSEENVLMCARRGLEILENAARCTKNYIIFSTCTFAPEENENNVDLFLSRHPEFTLVPPCERVKNVSSPSLTHPEARRVYPHTSVGEGQFFAIFKRLDTNVDSGCLAKDGTAPLGREDEKTALEFLNKNLISYNGILRLFKDNVILVPDALPVPEKITYSAGVTLGKIEKGVFRPHHQLFSSLGHLFKNKVELSHEGEEISKYLHGETFTCTSPDGWAAVTVDGVSIGGVKITGGTAKNHYPKGLRNM